MERARWPFVFGAVCVGLLLAPQTGNAQVATLDATKLFDTSAGNEQNALAFDDSEERLYTADSSDQLRAYDLDGTLAVGPVALPSTGRSGETGLHFVREALSIGGVALPPGTLTFIQAGLGNDPQNLNETTLYALDKTTGITTAAEALTTGFVPPPTGCPDILKDQAKGLGYSTQRGLFVSLDINCQGVAEIANGDVTGFFEVPGGIAGTSGGGGATVHPLTGNVWVVGALSEGNLAEFSDTGILLRRFDVVDVVTSASIAARRLEFDATGDRLFLLTFGAEVYLLPEPGGMLMLGVGIASLLGLSRLRRR